MVWRRWWWVAALVVLTCCGPGAAVAPAPGASVGTLSCRAAVRDWATRCAAREAIAFAAVECPEDALLLLDLQGEPRLRVSIQHSEGPAFRRVGPWGLSPVGDFADWSRVDPRMRERFDKVTACVRADARLDGRALRANRQPEARPDAPGVADSVPWRLLGALACALASLWPARRSAAWRRRALVGAALALGTLALRWLLWPALFFHQNGQGPFWVSTLLSPQLHHYGPGYRAVFGWVRWLTREPDRGVFLAQGVLASLAVPAAAFTARRLGASRALAGAVALAVAVDPMLGRLSRSESYYGLGSSLLFLATALLAAASTARRVRSAGFLLPALAAGLVVAQHALVHPVGWVAAALCPAVLLLAPGPGRRRLARTVAAVALIAAVVAVAAAPSMVAVLRSSLAAQWGGAAGGGSIVMRWRHAGPGWGSLLLAALAAGVVSRAWRRGALLAAVAVATAAAALAADIVSSANVTGPVHQAYLRLYAAAIVVLLATALAGLPRSRALARGLAAAVAVASLALAWRMAPAWTAPPTDALEQQAVLRWRRELSIGQVLYLERAGQRVLTLPLYGAGGPSPVPLRAGEFVADFGAGRGGRFYVRTSLCSTPEGRATCELVERRYQMTELRAVVLPAVPSMTYLPYDVPRVRVALYRVDGRNPGGP